VNTLCCLEEWRTNRKFHYEGTKFTHTGNFAAGNLQKKKSPKALVASPPGAVGREIESRQGTGWELFEWKNPSNCITNRVFVIIKL
jgi:hypothetical protein